MTVSSDLNRITYAGNGTTTVFAVNYYFLENSHLQVVLISATGVETVQTLTTNYTVSGAGNEAGGSITMLVAPPTGTTLVIQRNVPATQETDYLANDPFPAESHERALDKLTMLVQQNERDIDRALKIPLSAVGSTSTDLPIPVGNKLLAWNSDASAVTNFDPSDVITIVGQQTSYGDVFTGNGSTTNFSLTRSPGSVFGLDVSINGVTQVPNVDYILSGTTLSFTTAPPAAASKILARYAEVYQEVDADAQNVRYLPAGTGAELTTVQAKLRETVSVKDFGAVGDGITDDTAAIQAAIATGFRIYIPDGTYLFKDTLYFQNSVSGQSTENTILKADFSSGDFGETQIVRFAGSSGNEIENVSLECLTVDGNKTTDPDVGGVPHYGLRLDFCVNVTIRDVKFKDTKYHSLNIVNSNSINVLNCKFISPGNTQAAPYKGSCIRTDFISRNILVDGCYFFDWQDHAIYVGSGDDSSHQFYCKIVNNHFVHSSRGSHCITLREYASFVVVSNNTFAMVTSADGNEAIEVRGLRSGVISNNVFESVDGDAVAIRYRNVFGGVFKDTSIANNSFENQVTAMAIDSGASNLSVTGNNFGKCARFGLFTGLTSSSISSNVYQSSRYSTDYTLYFVDCENIDVIGNKIKILNSTRPSNDGAIYAILLSGTRQSTFKNNTQAGFHGIIGGANTAALDLGTENYIEGNYPPPDINATGITSTRVVQLALRKMTGYQVGASAITYFDATFYKGDITVRHNQALGSSPYSMCVESGTVGTTSLTGNTGSISANDNALVVTDASPFKEGHYITVAGLAKSYYRILSVNTATNTVYLYEDGDATVSGATLGWYAPTFEDFPALV